MRSAKFLIQTLFVILSFGWIGWIAASLTWGSPLDNGALVNVQDVDVLDNVNVDNNGGILNGNFNAIVPTASNSVAMCNQLTSPRLIKSHMPANLLPVQIWEKNQKIIYVARNAKDVIVSSFHFVKNLDMWRGDNIHDFVNDFLNNEIIYTNFWSHVVDFWKMRNESFIFFVTYEEMQRDLAGVLQRLCIFLERPQLTEEELKKTVKHLSFANMKANKQLNLTYLLKEQMPGAKEDFQFMRRGIVGSFKDELTPELQVKIDKWTQEFLGKHGLTEEDIFGQL